MKNFWLEKENFVVGSMILTIGGIAIYLVILCGGLQNC